MCPAFLSIGHGIADAAGTGGIMSSLYKSTLVGFAIAGLCAFPAFAEDVGGCDEINWKQQILSDFDGIEEACLEVVLHKGIRQARFEVEFDHVTAAGDVAVMMKLKDGARVERVFPAPSDFHAQSNTGKTDFAMRELAKGDVLDVFIPINRVVAATPTH